MASEEAATPETRFIRHIPAGSVELPNCRWMRSPIQKDYAICLDPENAFVGWLMLEGWDDNWVSVRKLTTADLIKLRDQASISGAHRALIMAHLERG
jgi:hypothetical protein